MSDPHYKPMPRRTSQTNLESITEGETVVSIPRFRGIVDRLVRHRKLSEDDALRKLVVRLCVRYSVWNLRGDAANIRFRDLGSAP
jgi:hypothetical protein